MAGAGRRYAVVEGRFVDEHGNERWVSGVREVARRPLSAPARAALRAGKERLYGRAVVERAAGADRSGAADSELGPHLGDMLDHARRGRLSPGATTGDAARVEVVISLRRQPRMTVHDQVERALLRGAIATRGDYHRAIAAALRARRADIARAQAPVVAAVDRAGGRVLRSGENTHLLVARVSLDTAAGLARRGDVARVELHTTDDDEVDGGDISAGHQLEQYIDAGYTGENEGNPYDITFAQVEGGGADNEHKGFRDTSSSKKSRIRGLYSCRSGGCSRVSNFSPGSERGHASSVAGIIFGDLRDDQDPDVSSTSAQAARSGYAGEARGWLFKGPSMLAFDHIAGMSGGTAPRVVNMSAGKASADPACEGRDSRSRAANELFESGKLLVKSAGNEDHPSSSDCTVTSPGSALGVFTVGSLGSSSSGGTSTVRDATISRFSSRGGTASQGGGRSIVDMAAYGYRRKMFNDEGGYSRSGGGTSYAAPTVTATALDVVDHYKHEYSDLIDDPGILVANLLLMGDRSTEDGDRATRGFDSLYGAGRLRARLFDSTGMDAPWGYNTGYVCVDDGEIHTLAINDGQALATDVDVFKAVLWWYDSRHEDDGTLDDVDLRLKTPADGTLESSLGLDNKERVFSRSVGGQVVELEIHGYRVSADATSCGRDAMKVYYAYFYEDSDRDDSDGPGSEVDPE